MYYVYLLKSFVNGDLYVGYTSDLKQRFTQHNSKRVRSTKPYAPWQLVYYEAYANKNDAAKREKHLKLHRVKEDLKIQISNSLK